MNGTQPDNKNPFIRQSCEVFQPVAAGGIPRAI
jgi:hypothetical protein